MYRGTIAFFALTFLYLVVDICRGGNVVVARNLFFSKQRNATLTSQLRSDSDGGEDFNASGQRNQGRSSDGTGFWKNWDTKLLSLFSSPEKFRLSDLLEQVKISMMERIKSNAAIAVKARSDTGWNGSGGGHGGHGGIPTLEIALLTLAFLTFAVFVINLIQQLLSRMMVAMGATTPMMAMGRKRRSLLPLPLRTDAEAIQDFSNFTAKILDAIEDADEPYYH